MLKLLLAVIAALLLVGLGTVTVPAGAHHCGCQEDNSGPGSTSSGSGSSGSGDDGSNSGTGNGDGCVSNSGPGNAGGDNSGPGNAEEDCPVDQPDDPGDSNDPGDNNNGSTNPTGSVGQTAGTSTVVAGVQASTGTTQAVPTAVAAGVTGEQDSGSTLGGLMILLGVATMLLALVHRRSRA